MGIVSREIQQRIASTDKAKTKHSKENAFLSIYDIQTSCCRDTQTFTKHFATLTSTSAGFMKTFKHKTQDSLRCIQTECKVIFLSLT